MLTYLIRRALYAVLILFGVNVVAFTLFFAVNTPDDMARMQLGGKRVTQAAVNVWKAERGYDRPLYFDAKAQGVGTLTHTVFFGTTMQLLRLDFGHTNEGRDIANEIAHRIVPSFAIAIPVFIVTVGISIVFALGMVMFRGHWLDTAGVILLVTLMSISSLFFIIVGQYVFSRVLAVAPISGFSPPPDLFKFIVLPVVVMVLARLGPDSRLYRTIYLEELTKDYVRTARAKGLSEFAVLLRHVLRNSLIPIITASGLLLPTLFVGAIVTETFFAIPGLGAFTIEGITQQDFNIVRAMVFFGSFVYIAAYLLTDVAYSWADPRIRLQ